MPIDLNKQFRFALAKSLTLTAKEAQKEVLGELRETFTIRTNWLQPSNAMGIKVLPADRNDLSAAVVTRAGWLGLHEVGGIKLPSGTFIAVPTKNVKRTKRDIIQRRSRPRQLTKTFIGTGKSGRKIIYQKTGKGERAKVRAMYILIEAAQIEKEPTVTTPTVKVFQDRFSTILFSELKSALATAKR